MKVGKAGPTTMVSRAKKGYKEDVKDGDAEGGDAERVRNQSRSSSWWSGWTRRRLLTCSPSSVMSLYCENHVRELRTFFTLSQSHASNVHFFCETLSLPQDFQ